MFIVQHRNNNYDVDGDDDDYGDKFWHSKILATSSMYKCQFIQRMILDSSFTHSHRKLIFFLKENFRFFLVSETGCFFFFFFFCFQKKMFVYYLWTRYTWINFLKTFFSILSLSLGFIQYFFPFYIGSHTWADFRFGSLKNFINLNRM